MKTEMRICVYKIKKKKMQLIWLKHTHSEGGDVIALLLALDVGYTKCPFSYVGVHSIFYPIEKISPILIINIQQSTLQCLAFIQRNCITVGRRVYIIRLEN